MIVLHQIVSAHIPLDPPHGQETRRKTRASPLAVGRATQAPADPCDAPRHGRT